MNFVVTGKTPDTIRAFVIQQKGIVSSVFFLSMTAVFVSKGNCV